MQMETWEIAGLSLTLRAIESRDLPQLAALTSQEVWLESLEEIRIMHEADPTAAMGLFLSDGTLVSTVSIFNIADDTSILSDFLTSRPYRGRGIGRKLFQHGVDIARPRSVSLLCTTAMADKYAKAGFQHTGINLKMTSGKVNRKRAAHEVKVDSSFAMSVVNAADVDRVCRYDSTVVGHDRSKFIAAWLTSPSSISILAKDGDKICGYFVMRQDLIGCKNTPMYKAAGFYAETPVVATQLLREMILNHLPDGADYWLHFPTPNEAAASEVAKQFGEIQSDESFNLYRMINGNVRDLPNCSWNKIYSVANMVNALA